MKIETPYWVKNSVFYQIFPDRFGKSKEPKYKIKYNLELEPWNQNPTLQGYKGGELWGVIEALNYIQNLGCDAIYFTPIFQSTSNHRYHTHDYFQVDPLLGGNEAFLSLLEAAHSRDIKVVLDGVFNHTGRGFFYFNDILENGPHSPWLNWFKIQGWPLSAYDGSKPANYRGWADNRALPEFNYDNPEVREYIMQIAEHWLKVGIDGWRLDVPFEIKATGFWQEFRNRTKAINPEAYIVGEIWGDSRQWLDGTQFDGVMNYLFTGPTIAFAAGERVVLDYVENQAYEPYPPLDAKGYGAKMAALLELYPWEIQLTQLNLLASHDTARLLSIAGGDCDSVKLATLLLLTFPGAPCIYYGDEVGLGGAVDPDSRRSFPPEESWHREILDCHKQLIALRHQYPALATGTYQIICAQGLIYAFKRNLGEQELIIVVNAGTTSGTISLKENTLQPNSSKLLYGNGELFGDDGYLSLTLSPRSGCIVGPNFN